MPPHLPQPRVLLLALCAGLTGILAMAADPAAPAARPALPRTAARIAAGQSVTIVLYGDSISEVGRSASWHGGASKPEANWGPVLAAMLQDAHPGASFRVKHFGVGGHNSYEGLGRLDYLAPFEPDLVLVAFGANDCGYHFLEPAATALALKSLVEGIRARYQADVVLVGSGGDDPAKPFFRHLAETLAATRQTAADTRTPYVDIRSAILAVSSDDGHAWADYHLMAGNCHPNDAGHRIWAQTAFTVIQQALAATPAQQAD